jgi:malonate-semialdehyde dehydrogenase (acetylating) / methylmalonate-semialdehyde dehydrogenase
MDTYVRREPLGVGAAICPFNFPAMIPLWNMVSIAAGNTLIIKPSERDPGATMIIAELCERAGLPPGVLSVMHGSKDSFVTLSLFWIRTRQILHLYSVNFLCDHPLVKAISFVGGDTAGKHIYDRAGSHGKRVQANMGAKSGRFVFRILAYRLCLNHHDRSCRFDAGRQ